MGVDPRLLPLSQFLRYQTELAAAGIELVNVEANLVDALWDDRPTPPMAPIQVHPLQFAGERFQDKLKRVRKAMSEAGAQAHVVAALDSIAWLFNIRGADVLHNPVVIAYAIVTHKTATLFALLEKVTPEVRAQFGPTVDIKPYATFRAALAQLGRMNTTVWVDPATTNQWIADLLSVKATLLQKESPIVAMKAAKNAAEIRGMKQAHIRDGVAMVRFLSWLDKAVGKEPLTEISVADKLEGIRGKSRRFQGVSFDSIVGYAGHGAIVHYSATPATDARIQKRGLLLVDSGGQYLDGTTDITRTIALSNPTPAQKDQFTRVLKGHIAVATAAFPAGTAGRQLDTLARKALWDAGYDYAHGTGHGVGAYLSVHEGPQSISYSREGVPLLPGMVLSNEPGYYETGHYGIRTENLVYVVKDEAHTNGERPWYRFENLTLCPIDLRLVDPHLLTSSEIRYLNAYHTMVKRTLTPLLDHQDALWLARATKPIR